MKIKKEEVFCPHPCWGEVHALGLCSKHYQEHRAVAGRVGCTELWCVAPALARGLCGPHYRKARSIGEFPDTKTVTVGTCREEDCEDPEKAKGLCNKHYLREWRKR